MTSENKELIDKEKLGHRRAHQAALYANLRLLIALSLREDNPVLGLHGVYITEKLNTYLITAGSTPEPDVLLSAVGSLQGCVLMDFVARRTGDLANAHIGDTFDAKLGVPRCENCDDGDPDGAHAREELVENARAWLGLMILVAERFYGERLPDVAKRLLCELKAFALLADAEVK